MSQILDANPLRQELRQIISPAITGTVIGSEGVVIAVAGFPVPLGALVEIQRGVGTPVQGEVIGFRADATLVFPHEELSGVGRGNQVRLLKSSRQINVSPLLCGRVINALGKPIDGKGPIPFFKRMPIQNNAPLATERPRIDRALSTGVRALDGLLTCGRGQRMGVFAGSGVGKSVTMGMMARNTAADINVIAMIGERGREVNEFIEESLGAEGLERSVVVVATSDQPALMRVQAAYAATTIAEFFRDQGQDVLLMMDSLTRFAMAQREIGLAAGEPPTTRGYPPSVFATLPRLVERAGCNQNGSITAFYTVLVEGDDNNEPISDTVRGLLDGHCFLSRKLAAKGHYPAIDVTISLSRLMNELANPEHRQAAMILRNLLAVYAENEDLITIGAYRAGSNPEVDRAISARQEINRYLQQAVEEKSDSTTAIQQLVAFARKWGGGVNPQVPPTPPQSPPGATQQLPTPNPQNRPGQNRPNQSRPGQNR